MLDTTTDAGGRAERRLREEEDAWMTTVRGDGQPQSVPVWFVWDGEGFLIYSQERRQKLRNIASNPRVGINLNSNAIGNDVVRVEGTAEVAQDAPPADEVEAYVEKYRDGIARIDFDVGGFARSYSVTIRVTLRAGRSGSGYDHSVSGLCCGSRSTSRSTFSLKKQRWSRIFSTAEIGSG